MMERFYHGRRMIQWRDLIVTGLRGSTSRIGGGPEKVVDAAVVEVVEIGRREE